MYYVFGKIGKLGQFERMDKAVDHARGTSVYESSLTVENSNGEILCYIGDGEILWRKEEYLEYYHELKKGEK